MECNLSRGANSGVYVRTRFGGGWKSGYEAQLSNQASQETLTGGIYGLTVVKKRLVADDEWFELRFRVEGRRLSVYVNGKRTSETTVPIDGPSNGAIALQSWNRAPVRFRKVEIKELPSSESSATGRTDRVLPKLLTKEMQRVLSNKPDQADGSKPENNQPVVAPKPKGAQTSDESDPKAEKKSNKDKQAAMSAAGR